jgi:predicted  nucleic acid-binding Zn-ribbon protein
MIEIREINQEDVTTDGNLNITLLVNEINNRLGNLDKNINSVNTKYANLRKAFVDLKTDFTVISSKIDRIIEEHFDNEE